MEQKSLSVLEEQFFSFREEIRVDSDGPFRALFQALLRKRPEALYYYSGYSAESCGAHHTVRVEYRNTEYPPGCILRLDAAEWQQVLRQAVLRGVKRVVVLLPKRVNFRWLMECFWKQERCFYPQLESYSYAYWKKEQAPQTLYEIQFTYRIGAVRLRQMEQAVEQQVHRLCRRLFPIPMPDSAKCFIAHNYLADTVRYCGAEEDQKLEKRYRQSAYGALLEGRCVCQGYAEAYKRILNCAGIPCDLVSGDILDEEGGLHAWNIVHLNGDAVRCHVDVTWDSARDHEAVRKTHFLKGDAFYAGKRDWPRFYYTPCSDGSALLEEARRFCAAHVTELLQCGLQPTWIQ